MNKLQNHFKQFGAIYLILLLALCITLIILIKPNKKEEKSYDTSMFNVVDTKGAVKLFSSNTNQVLFIGRPSCSVCEQFVPYLQIAMAQYHFKVSYLNTDDINQNSEEYKELLELLDYDLPNDDRASNFKVFLEMKATPLFIIIKNNKMVYGYAGLMTNETIGSVVTQYGINQ